MSKPEYLQFGGMAVPEGVMMRSPRHVSIACRAPNGKIVVTTEPIEKTWIGRQKWLMKPFLRGSWALLDTMGLGLRSMRWASDVQLKPEYQKPGEEDTVEGVGTKEKLAIGAAVVVSLALGFLIFDAAPEGLAQVTQNALGFENTTITNYIAEVVKIVFFIAYLALIRRMPAILEVFRYHGAEHKAIHTHEDQAPLTAANVMERTRLHPRCGTNFAIIVLIVSFLLFPLVPRELFPGEGPVHDTLVVASRLGLKLLILPIIAGISYEIIRAAGNAKDQRWVEILLKPGLATQLITTEPPKEEHCEVAVASLQSAIHADRTGELIETDDWDELRANRTEFANS